MDKMYETIVNDYINSNCKTYKEFYDSNLFNYNISYSKLCNVFKNVKLKTEIVFIRKIKNKGFCFFEIIDYETQTVLMTFNSVKNDTKSIKNIIYLLIKDYGCSKNISFVNFFSRVPFLSRIS